MNLYLIIVYQISNETHLLSELFLKNVPNDFAILPAKLCLTRRRFDIDDDSASAHTAVVKAMLC